MLIQKTSVITATNQVSPAFFSKTFTQYYNLKSLIPAYFICIWALLITFNTNAAPPTFINQDLMTHSPEEDLSFERLHSIKRTEKEEWITGRILVMPRAGLPNKAFASILKEHQGKAQKIGQSDLYIVNLPEYTEEGVIAKLKHHPHIKYAELDYLLHSSFVPNDQYYSRAWHHTKIGTPTAWNSTRGTGVTIAILDTGVDNTHPDLTSNIVPGWNFYSNNSNTTDVNGHGTAVAGVAAASTNNTIGVASVAGSSKIMPVRVADANATASASTVAKALTWVADKGVRVANISYSGIPGNLTIQNAAQYMKNKNGLVIVAAGNSGTDLGYTATTTMIPVSATDSNDVKTSWSSFGKYVAISAPGKDIWTTFRNTVYGIGWGTSMATPVTAGTVALMMAANPKLSSTQVESLLFSTAKDLGTAGRDSYYGYGRVNAAAAVQAAKAAATTTTLLTAATDSEKPVASIINPANGATVSGLVSVDIEASDNVGVIRTELWVNNTNVAIDTLPPYAFTWDSTGVPNSIVNLVVRAYDEAGNSTTSDAISVTVSNQTAIAVNDTTPPQVSIVNPISGSVAGNVTITMNASDNSGSAGITLSLYIDNNLKAVGSGSTLSYNWNTKTKSVLEGSHVIKAIAKDASGNTSTSTVNVIVVK